MAGKQQKPNGYLLFAQNYQKIAKRTSGESLSLQQAIALASIDWEKLSKDERAAWKEKAMEKRRLPGSSRPVTRGFQLEVERRRPKDYYHDPEEADAYNRKRTLDIKELNSSIFFNSNRKLEWLLEQEFVFVSVIPYLETAERRFLPAELALIRFKIGDGVLDLRHFLLALDLDEHPELSEQDDLVSRGRDDPVSGHGIWPGRVEALECNYDMVFEQIWAIISTKRFVFCHAAHYNEVRGCLNWLRDKFLQSAAEAKKGPEPSLVALEELVKVMCHFPSESVPLNQEPALSDIEEALCPTSLNEAELADPTAICKFHKDNLNQNCAVRLARTSLWGACLMVAKHQKFRPTPPAVLSTRIPHSSSPESPQPAPMGFKEDASQ